MKKTNIKEVTGVVVEFTSREWNALYKDLKDVQEAFDKEERYYCVLSVILTMLFESEFDQ